MPRTLTRTASWSSYRARLAAVLALAFAACASAQIGADPDTLAGQASLEVERQDDGTFRTQAGIDVEPLVRNGALYAVRMRSGSFDVEAAHEFAALVGAATGFGESIEQAVLDFLDGALPELAGSGPSVVGIERFRLTLDVTAGEEPFEATFALALAEVSEDAFPPSRHTKGPDDAAIVIREFSDFQCPACRRFVAEVLPMLEASLLPRGDVRIEFHHFPLIGSFANSFRAAEVAECVVDANPDDDQAFWSYHDEIYERQPQWAPLADPDDTFLAIADEVGLETAGVETCLADGRHVQTVQDAYQAAAALQLRGTPSVFVGGFQVDNFVDLSAYHRAIGYLEAFGMADAHEDSPGAD